MEVEAIESTPEIIQEVVTATVVTVEHHHAKKTKEEMMHEPLPLFDCIYCVKDSASVFQMVSDNFLA